MAIPILTTHSTSTAAVIDWNAPPDPSDERLGTLLVLEQTILSRYLHGTRPTLEKHADPMDMTVAVQEADQRAGEMDREAHHLRRVREAIQAIRDGNGGVCTECDELISEKRLAAVPWAMLCKRCQEREERERERER